MLWGSRCTRAWPAVIILHAKIRCDGCARSTARPSVSDVKKLVEHVLTTFKNFPVETLSDMWRTKTRVLKAIVACDGGNDYAIPRSNTD